MLLARAAVVIGRLVLIATSAAVISGCDRARPASPTPVDALDSAFAQARLEPNLRHLVVARNGSVVRAEYFNGGGPDSPEYVWSVTKSVLALTVGAALDAGCLRSLDETLGELLGPAMVTDSAKAAVTLRHLLTIGWGGQFIAVVPAKGLVITTSSRTTGLSGPAAMAQWDRIFEIVSARLIPAF